MAFLPNGFQLKPITSPSSNIRSYGITAATRGSVFMDTSTSNFLKVHLWPRRRCNRQELRNNDEKSEIGRTPVEFVGGKKKALSIENWIFKILRVSSRWKDRKSFDGDENSDNLVYDCGKKHEEGDDCGMDRVSGENLGVKGVAFDRTSFSEFLRRVSLSDAKVYAQMSYLGNLAYYIPRIKPENLLRYHHLRFVTSSMEGTEINTRKGAEGGVEEEQQRGIGISANSAFQIAASAALYLQSHTRTILPFRSPKGNKPCEEEGEGRAELRVTTDSITAVVVAKEEVKQAVADDLSSSSTSQSPCKWFICDSIESETRLFIIQGSESLASWQANLLFEPVLFEGLDYPVHRGIYEAAKGIYSKLLPYVKAHMAGEGGAVRWVRFTGHSLGGSLALLVSLMLLLRGAVRPASLLPVITFGAPSIMCGGDGLLAELGLPPAHLRAVAIHRDIVPRAFSCTYPPHVADFLKAVNRSFRDHHCLHHQKVLYSPMGEFLILQPDEKVSPPHGLLPEGSGLYVMRGGEEEDGRVREAQSVFMNTPHPLEILSDRSSYGPSGTIQRDHDVKTYLRAMRGVVSEEFRRLREPSTDMS